MELIWLTILLMGGIGITASIVLYFVAKRFKVEEDERVLQIEEVLPGATCLMALIRACFSWAATGSFVRTYMPPSRPAAMMLTSPSDNTMCGNVDESFFMT